MDEIIPNLWLGNLRSALNNELLRENNIQSVLSVMKGKNLRLRLNQNLTRHQIELDDSLDADALSCFLPAIKFIGSELERGRPILVHCLAGMSRSPTIVAAYLMYTLNVTPDEALNIILKQRPYVQPNQSFSDQLHLFYDSQLKVSKNDKEIRRFYLKGAVHEILNGEGLTTEMLSTFPNLSPTSQYQRRIRCKMCRQQLATHEHMLSHGQPPSDRQPLPNSTSQAPQQDSSSATDLEPASASTPSTNGATIGQQFSESSGSSDEVVDNSDSIGPVRNLRSNSKRNMPPILINPRCSGYFVEPMKWMDHFLSAGSPAGKIICPNKKCNAKLGNYDWAGVHCGCKSWVTPGFCINRSKVDEVG